MTKVRIGVGKAILVILVILAASCGGNDTKLSSNCVNVFETLDSSISRYDLHLNTFGFQDYIAKDFWLVTIANANGVELLSNSRIEIEKGAFGVEVPDGVTSYAGVGVYIDLNENSRCDLDEPSWEYTTGTPTDREDAVLSPNGKSTFIEAECMINGLYSMNEKVPCS